MKKFKILHLNLFLILSFISTSVFASAGTENIWLLVFLIPVYLVLVLQTLLVLFALLMKQFKTKQSVLMSVIIAGILMLLGLGLTYYHEPLEKLWTPILYFSLIGIVVFILPFIQFKFLNKSNIGSNENET